MWTERGASRRTARVEQRHDQVVACCRLDQQDCGAAFAPPVMIAAPWARISDSGTQQARPFCRASTMTQSTRSTAAITRTRRAVSAVVRCGRASGLVLVESVAAGETGSVRLGKLGGPRWRFQR